MYLAGLVMLELWKFCFAESADNFQTTQNADEVQNKSKFLLGIFYGPLSKDLS